MTVNEVIDHFGGAYRTALSLGVSPPAVSKWIANDKIPWTRQRDIELETKGKLVADPRPERNY